MKKLIIFLLVLAVSAIPTYSFAGTARNASGSTLSQTRTNLSNLALTGLDVTGNPGLLTMIGVAVSAESFVPEYHLWVDETGDLCMASTITLENNSVDFEGDWEAQGGCDKVGGQS